MKRASAATLTSVFTELQNLKALRAQLLREGDREVANAVERAMRELQSPAVATASSQVSGAGFDVRNP